MQVKEIDLTIAKPFIEKWHYSGVVPTGKNFFFGWYDGDILYAVADYGIGVNPYQAKFLSNETGKNVKKCNLLELKRLCRIEPSNGTYLSQFISVIHKSFLKPMGYEFVVSFSDPEYGHNGGIYKASNFIHLGVTNPEWHLIDKDGNKRHRRYAYRYAQRHNIDLKKAREILGVRRIKTLPKDRWFIQIH